LRHAEVVARRGRATIAPQFRPPRRRLRASAGSDAGRPITADSASVNFAGRTSMEVGVKVWQEDRATGERKHVVSAYLTFVSLDPDTRKPREVPPILPKSEEEKRRFADAKRRRELRIQLRNEKSKS
jgi:hypothetical protein